MLRLFKYKHSTIIRKKVGLTAMAAYPRPVIRAGLVPKKIFSPALTRCFKPSIINCKCTQFISVKFTKCVQPTFVGKEILRVRCFHTSNPRRAPPSLLVLILRPFINLAVIVFGRALRKWWQSLPAERKAALILKIRQYRNKITGFVTLISVTLVHGYLSHLEENPVTKRWRFMLFTHEQMKQIADIELEVLIEEYKDSFLQANHKKFKDVVDVANRILAANRDVPGIEDTKWKVTVVDHPTLENAFVLPNGAIFIFTKMIDLCDNEDQLGLIIAHEISHSLLQHMAEQLSKVQIVEWLLVIPLIIVWAVLPDGAALFFQWFSGVFVKVTLHLPFSRFIEMEADQVGLRLAAKACFDVREAPAFWRKMSILQEGNKTELLSTHPNHETRERFLEQMMPEVVQLRGECNCPPLQDPVIHGKKEKRKSHKSEEIIIKK